MTWTTYHRRGEVLNNVIAAANARGDGLLPTDVEGVAAVFRDELDLLGALQLRWHTRLSGRIDGVLGRQPRGRQAARGDARGAPAGQMPGVRAVLDRALADGVGPEADRLLGNAVAKERMMLAAMAGRSSYDDEAAVAVGASIEDRARAAWAVSPPAAGTASTTTAARSTTLIDRLRSALAS
jgi:hypothetical protein